MTRTFVEDGWKLNQKIPLHDDGSDAYHNSIRVDSHTANGEEEMMKPPEFDDPTGFYTRSATYWPGISDMGAEAFPLGMKLTRGRERSTPQASFLGKRPERAGSAPAHPRSMGGVRTRIPGWCVRR